ncbi:DUF6020 family protein [Butyrivibrio sp. VCD2006]|uniref:DUF6020 family protein n=1 Tax=Butyrivibrio sp. VCD2006 TaxID=1280664 RepID=UPI0003F9609C|nr:DUF6020 family protein [Butyrivibrio sp. VCD2006]
MVKRDISIILCIISVISWVSFWDNNTDTFFQNYFLLGGFALAAVFHYKKEVKLDFLNILLSIIFSSSVMLANYKYVDEIKQWIGLWLFGIVIFYNCIYLLEMLINKAHKSNEFPIKERWIWCILTFVSVVGMDYYYLFTVAWPGLVTYDSTAMIRFFILETYTNHHPYYMIRYMKVLYDISMAIWGDINSFVGLYSVIQVLVVSMFFVYFVDTLVKQKLPRICIVLTIMGYTFLPYNIKYSVTMWKDVPFALCLTGIVASFIRIIRCSEHECRFDYLMMFMCTLGVGVLRNNGVYCLLAFVFGLWIFKSQIKRKMIITVFVSMVIGIIMNGPLLGLLSVSPTETAESLSIPIQQISRVIVDDGYLSENQITELINYLPVDKVKELYVDSGSDPIKSYAVGVITEDNITNFLTLWAKIGVRNPICYLHAWIDQTKGFWCAGFPNNVWWDPMIFDNDFGIKSSFIESAKTNPIEEYIWKYRSKASLSIFISIGLHIWIMFALVLIHFKKKDYSYCIMCLPLIALWGTLLIASPVNGEFRYLYSVFLTMPLLLFENRASEK